MPAPSRAQRRRANLQKQASGSQQPRPTQPLAEPAFTGETMPLVEQDINTATNLEVPVAPVPSYGTRPARQTRQPRQAVKRPTPAALAPVDYSEDYRHARRDLVRIFIWSALLFAAMIIIHFTGIL